MTTWLLLSLLTVQTVTGRGLRQRDFNDARDTLREELEDLVPKQLPAGKHDIEHLTVLQTFPSVCEHLGLAHFLPVAQRWVISKNFKKRTAVYPEKLFRC